MIDTSTAQSIAEGMRGITAYNKGKHDDKMEVLKAMRDDNLHGMTKTDIKEKFFDGKYGKDFTGNADGGRNAFNKYWKDMNQAFFDDFDEPSKEDLRKRLIAKYMHAYGWFVGKGEMGKALKALDSLYKCAGLDQPPKTITLPSDVEKGEITISFGLDK